jgi:hypothetical protein
MKVLVACEESQAITIAFRKLGVEAYSCDTQDCSGGHPEWHIKGDAVEEAYIPFKYQVLIAHPPCTYMSKAGARWMYPTSGIVCENRLKLGMEAKEFFMKMLDAPIPFKRIENPVPLKIIGLPPHSQAIQPFEHGHGFSKKTLLWNVGLPDIRPTHIIDDYVPYLPSNTGGKKRGQSYMFKNISQKDSSKTFEGIANAIAIQTTRYIRQMIFNDTSTNRF